MPFDILDTETAPQLAGTFGAPQSNVGKNLAKLRADLKLRLKSRGDLDVTELDDFINDAYLEVCSELKLDELRVQFAFTTVSGQASYKLPSGVGQLSGVRLVDSSWPVGGLDLVYTEEDYYARLEVATDSPCRYMHVGEYLVLWPIPSGTYRIAARGYTRPQPLVLDTDSPILRPELHLALSYRVSAVALSKLDGKDAAADDLALYLAAVRPKIDPATEERSNSPASISVPRSARDLRRGSRSSLWD